MTSRDTKPSARRPRDSDNLRRERPFVSAEDSRKGHQPDASVEEKRKHNPERSPRARPLVSARRWAFPGKARNYIELLNIK